jgi:hemoglobin
VTAAPVGPSIYEAAGGEAAFLALAAATHARCLADPELEHPFSHGGHPQHVERLGWYWAEVLGGPPRFSRQEDGDETSVLRLHSGNGDMTGLGERFHACFVAAMDDAGLPADPDLRAALTEYMTWAVARVNAHPVDSATVPARLPVPRWTWDGPAT